MAIKKLDVLQAIREAGYPCVELKNLVKLPNNWEFTVYAAVVNSKTVVICHQAHDFSSKLIVKEVSLY